MRPFSWRFIRVWQRNRDVFFRLWHAEAPGSIAEPIIILLAMGVGLGAYVGLVDGQKLARRGAEDQIRRLRERDAAGRQLDGALPALRRITKSDVRAALQPELELHFLHGRAARIRDTDLEPSPVSFLLAEEFVLVHFADRKLRRA